MPEAGRQFVVSRRFAALLLALAASCLGVTGTAWLAHASHLVAPLSPDDLKAAAIVVDAERGEVLVDGDLADGTAKRLRVLLRANPAVRIISFASDGGLVDEAEQVGDIIAAHDLVTVVRSSCVSACTLAFVRGRERLAQDGARFGFHAPWVPGEEGSEEQVASDDERQAYLAAGLAAEFVTEALAVPSTSIWFPDGARLLEARVVTGILPADGLLARLAKVAEPRRLAAAPE